MGYSVVREYVEHENGGKGVEYRQQLAVMFAGAARREFDLLLVWSLDRFSREGMAATVGTCSASPRRVSHSGRTPKSTCPQKTNSSAISS
jgi:DNA invertase Pin-like site-specific DNA recombinase